MKKIIRLLIKGINRLRKEIDYRVKEYQIFT